MDIVFWNMQGFKNMSHFLRETTIDFDIICVCETWLVSDLVIPLFFHKKYRAVSRSATKEKSRGRGSGGLAIFYNEKYTADILDTSPWWLNCLFTTRHYHCSKFIVCFVYFNPSCNIEDILELFQVSLNEILENYNQHPIILLGDFNSRVGEIASSPSELLENTNFYPTMLSRDKTVTARGRTLLEFMASNNFSLINGSVATDRPANFTFISPRGCSLIDLAFCNNTNLNYIDDLTVLEYVTPSDHLPVRLRIQQNKTVDNINSRLFQHRPIQKVLGWKESSASLYKDSIKYSPSVGTLIGTPNELYLNLKSAIWDAAEQCNLTHYTKPTTVQRKTRWFDTDCFTAKKKVKELLKICKQHVFIEPYKSDYLSAKAQYKKLLKVKKNNHDNLLINTLSNTKDQSNFWKTVKHFKTKNSPCTIPIATWEVFYSNIYVDKSILDYTFYDAANIYLDKHITMDELLVCLKSCKNNKSPGGDGISYEFFKNLPQNWLLYLCTLFNKVLDTEIIPSAWCDTILTMIHKKGPVEDPANYRGIALLNCTEKIFSSILLHRLSCWVEDLKIIPECQSGFRRNRGCLDNIFILSSVIQLHLRMRGRKIFAAFVDFKRAFDTINHNILWPKLYRLGISAKYLRLLKKLYDRATVRIKSNNKYTETFDISCGVLQGEPLSPILFSLFISDIEEFFKSKGSVGVNIDGINSLLLLLYADDLVILSDSQADLQRKLNVLQQYSDENNLTVNVTKTKIVIFSRGGYSRNRNVNFYYANENIEIVNKFAYLGVTFSSSSLYLEMAKTAVTKAKQALGAIFDLMVKSKMQSWDARIKVYQSVIISSLAYSVGIWGLRYTEILERIQVSFFKQLLSLAKTTPDYIVRLETNTTKLSHIVLKSALSWLQNLQTMDSSRLPKLCYLRLKQLNNIDTKFNWLLQIKDYFRLLNEENIFLRLETGNIKNINKDILLSYEKLLIREDKIKLSQSTFPCLYNFFSNNGLFYLKQSMPIFIIRLFAQLRTSGKNYLKFSYRGLIYMIDTNQICTVCNLQKNETLEHLLLKCPLYKHLRTTLFSQGADINNLVNLLDTATPKLLRSIAIFVINILKLRSFVLNE